MNLRQLHEEISIADSELTMAWCRRYGLLKTERTCTWCNNEMCLVVRSGVDGKIWQCGRPCRARVSVREGTFFAHLKLPLAKIMEFIYAWAYEDVTFKKAKREFGISQQTFVDWKMFLRDVCGEYFVAHPVRIRGVGHTVQIDKSVFTRRKYNRGHMIREQWVLEVLIPRQRQVSWYLWIEGTLPLCSLSSNNSSFLEQPLSLICGVRIILWVTSDMCISQ